MLLMLLLVNRVVGVNVSSSCCYWSIALLVLLKVCRITNDVVGLSHCQCCYWFVALNCCWFVTLLVVLLVHHIVGVVASSSHSSCS